MTSSTDTKVRPAGKAAKRDGAVPRVLGILLLIAAVLLLVGGGVAWGLTSAQLKAENMTVPGDARSNAGKQVAGPLTAWSMQEVIQMHTDKITGGKTYAELGAVVEQAKEEFGADSEEAAAAQGLRTTAQSASGLRASLFTSILAFGVSFLVMALGISTGITGAAFLSIGNQQAKRQARRAARRAAHGGNGGCCSSDNHHGKHSAEVEVVEEVTVVAETE